MPVHFLKKLVNQGNEALERDRVAGKLLTQNTQLRVASVHAMMATFATEGPYSIAQRLAHASSISLQLVTISRQ